MTNKTKINWNDLTPDMLDGAIALIGKNSETLQLRVHIVLNTIAVDWASTTDQKTAVLRVNALIDGLADGVRKQAIVAWVVSPKLFGMLEAEKTVDGAKPGTTKQIKVIVAGKMKAKNIDLPFIRDCHWWSFTREPQFHAFNLAEKITKLVVEADKVAKKADKRNSLPVEILDALRAVEKMTPVS